MAKRLPIHPGEILKTEFLDEFEISAYALAKALNVPVNRVTGINGERGITADTFGWRAYFDTTPEVWLNLETHYDLEVARRRDARRIDREVQRRTASN